nr:hypothetical protein CFP56_14979 [Quercus suber]
MRDPRSRKATYVCIQAPLSCRIQFICKSLLIHTREEGKPPLRTRSVSSSPNRKNIEAGPLNLQRSLSVDTLRHRRIMDIPFREGSEELLSPKSGLVVEGSTSDESCSYGSSRRSLPCSSYSTSPSTELSDVILNAWTGENANRNELSVFSPKRSLASSSSLINPSASTMPKCSSNGSRSVVDGGLDNTLFGEVQKAKPNAEKETHLRLNAEKDYFEALNMVVH